LLLYPFAVLGAPFDTGPLLWVPFLSSVGLLAATFDVLCQLDSSERPSATLTAWAVILFLAALHAGACLSPTEVLIEPPLENAWAVLVLLLLFATPPHARGGSFVPLASGVVLAGGYVLKKSFVAALPLGVALYSLSVEKSCDRRAARKATRSALLVLGPLGVAVTIWTISSRKFVPAFSLLATHSARSASVSVSAVFTAMTAATVGLLRAQGLFAGVCAVAALGLAI